jgi:hypothetical protein
MSVESLNMGFGLKGALFSLLARMASTTPRVKASGMREPAWGPEAGPPAQPVLTSQTREPWRCSLSRSMLA